MGRDETEKNRKNKTKNRRETWLSFHSVTTTSYLHKKFHYIQTLKKVFSVIKLCSKLMISWKTKFTCLRILPCKNKGLVRRTSPHTAQTSTPKLSLIKDVQAPNLGLFKKIPPCRDKGRVRRTSLIQLKHLHQSQASSRTSKPLPRVFFKNFPLA